MNTQDCDLLVVGGGPSGLAAAINGASEGLNVYVLDGAPTFGGQARESAAIENYPMPLGSDGGVTGEKLMSGFINQARKFGTVMQCPVRATKLHPDGKHKVILTDDRSEFAAKSVILSNGLSYRRHDAEGIGPLMGRGVFYGVPEITDKVLAKKDVGVIGGANSAGQAVLRLARVSSCTVKLFVRKKLADRMSRYLIDRINAAPNIEVYEDTVVTAVHGRKCLDAVTLNGARRVKLRFIFIFIGAQPRTYWLDGLLDLTPKGFIVTDNGKGLPYETSIPGVFAAGDVREGSTKRIAAAIGEGSAALQMVHRYLN